MKKILLLVNPNARSGPGAFKELEDAITAAGHSIVPLNPQDNKKNFRSLIFAFEKEVDMVIIGGGDGSINYTLPALIQTKLPLLVYPLGTANLLARSFNLKATIDELLTLIDEGVTVPIDIGKVNGIPFINVCGLGISTEVNRKVTKRLKKLTGPFSFWIMGLRLIRSLKPYKIKITVEDQSPLVIRAWQITICNGRKYGAWMTIEPDASYNDQLLHCLSTEVSNFWQGLKLLPSYIKGSYKKHHEVNLLKGRKIVIESKKNLQIDVDGDVQTQTPATFEVLPGALRLVIPRECLHDESPIHSADSFLQP